jgi:hypothetical protein
MHEKRDAAPPLTKGEPATPPQTAAPAAPPDPASPWGAKVSSWLLNDTAHVTVELERQGAAPLAAAASAEHVAHQEQVREACGRLPECAAAREARVAVLAAQQKLDDLRQQVTAAEGAPLNLNGALAADAEALARLREQVSYIEGKLPGLVEADRTAAKAFEIAATLLAGSLRLDALARARAEQVRLCADLIPAGDLDRLAQVGVQVQVLTNGTVDAGLAAKAVAALLPPLPAPEVKRLDRSPFLPSWAEASVLSRDLASGRAGPVVTGKAGAS